VSIGLIGPGLVGGALLEQLASQVQRLARDFKLDLRVRGISSTKKMLLAKSEIDLVKWRDAFKAAPKRLTLRVLPSTCMRIICRTRSSSIVRPAPISPSATPNGCRRYSCVTPNKRANTLDMAFYDRLHASRRNGGAHYLYEATVGAGLPVIQTLRDLRETGDEIRRIEGILSGTLAYLFNVWDGSTPFSTVVRDAKAKGYTEPDPRDDLSGVDFARKIVILGREMGLRLEMGDVQLEGLVPNALAGCGVEEFLARLPEFDAPMLKRLEAARARGKVLRYWGRSTRLLAKPPWGWLNLSARTRLPISILPITSCASRPVATIKIHSLCKGPALDLK